MALIQLVILIGYACKVSNGFSLVGERTSSFAVRQRMTLTRHRYVLGSSSSRDHETDATVPSPSTPETVTSSSSNSSSSNNSNSFDLSAFSDNLSIDPEQIEIVEKEWDSIPPPDGESNKMFVPMFRGSANYIANHRGTTAVYHIPGGILEKSPDKFKDLMNDVALTWLLGMNIVLVSGCRHQIEQRISAERPLVNGLHVTDEETLRIIKEEAGYVRFEVERQLSRSLRLHGTADNADGNVVSGNFYSAQPFGILDGVDYRYTGFVRRVEVEKIRALHHQQRDICLLTTLGISPSGEVFNVNSEALAATVAGALGASKSIFFTEEDVILRNKEFQNQIQSLRLSDATNLLNHYELRVEKRGILQFEQIEEEKDSSEMVYANGDSPPAPSSSVVDGDDDVKLKKKSFSQLSRVQRDMLTKIGWAKAALEQGVKRAHILAPTQGALLQELYTRDGSGTLVSRDIYEGIRRANVNDVVGIYDLISPLIQMGTLVDRPKAVLEKDIDNYYVYTRDNLVVACGQLKKFEGGFAEIGCLVVKKEYRASGRGDSMLGYLERLSLRLGSTRVFVLSTQTMEWFIERGFESGTVEMLPPSRQATYNHKRASKIYMKEIDSDRELDAAELWWTTAQS